MVGLLCIRAVRAVVHDRLAVPHAARAVVEDSAVLLAAVCRPDAMVDHYVREVRQFAMYRGDENIDRWDDADKRLGRWRRAFTSETIS